MAIDRRSFWGLVIIVVVAVLLRAVDFPPRYLMRDDDERAYVQGGFALWEGITPTYDRTPAGPQTWISWLYAAGRTARYVVFPSREERAAPLVLRPFVAGNHALFDLYRDWSIPRWLEVAAGEIVAILGAAAGYKLGHKRGGLLPAILIGGSAAVLPLFVELSGQARPYAMAWGFGFIALYFAAFSDERPSAWWKSAVFMGLSVACRIDMLLLLPVGWADVWQKQRPPAVRWRRVVFYTLLAAMVAYLVAPWLLTDLVGNLRSIGTVRIAGAVQGAGSARQTLVEAVARQGLGVDLILIICALFLTSPDKNRIRWGAGIFVLLLSLSMLKGTAFGLRHQGAPIVALVTFAGVGLAAVEIRWPRMALLAVVVALAVPSAVVAGQIVQRRRLEMSYHGTQWIERHVPSGSVVYLQTHIADPLPTVQASNALWDQVADPNAWKIKIATGMARFHIASEIFPRAFSESDMVLERGLRREWYILGSRPTIAEPRFDIHLIKGSEAFFAKDVVGKFHRSGGVFVFDDAEAEVPSGLGTPLVQWLNAQGKGVRIYCSADMRPRLLDQQNLQEW